MSGGGELGQNYQSVLDSNNTKTLRCIFLSTLTSILSANVTKEQILKTLAYKSQVFLLLRTWTREVLPWNVFLEESDKTRTQI